MRRIRLISTMAVVLVVAAACGDASGEGDPEARARGGPATTASTDLTTTLEPFPDAVSHEDFDPERFGRSFVIDNEWMPLVPGTRYVYQGRAIADTGPVRRRIEFTVTDLTKMVAGVRTLVVWILDFDDDRLVEAELAFRAQDRDGNVWHLGEFPQELENGVLAAAPAWIAGVDGAMAGIAMEAEPRLDGIPYRQGFAPPPIDWDDHGQVHAMGRRTCVPVRCFEDVLITEEFEPEAPGAFQLKYYAPGVGNVRVGWTGLREEERETLVLTEYERLGPQALASLRAQALSLERHAYSVSKRVYGRTAPARPLPARFASGA